MPFPSPPAASSSEAAPAKTVVDLSVDDEEASVRPAKQFKDFGTPPPSGWWKPTRLTTAEHVKYVAGAKQKGKDALVKIYSVLPLSTLRREERKSR